MRCQFVVYCLWETWGGAATGAVPLLHGRTGRTNANRRSRYRGTHGIVEGLVRGRGSEGRHRFRRSGRVDRQGGRRSPDILQSDSVDAPTQPGDGSVRALGIDFGERRIGLALSDETGTIASPLTTLSRRRGKRPPLRRIEDLAHQYDVEALVLGLPLELTGEESAWSRQVREIGDRLAVRLGIPVHLVDERLTSVRATRAVRGIGLPRRKREDRTRIDAAAAALILQGWLDGLRREDAPTEIPPAGNTP